MVWFLCHFKFGMTIKLCEVEEEEEEEEEEKVCEELEIPLE